MRTARSGASQSRKMRTEQGHSPVTEPLTPSEVAPERGSGGEASPPHHLRKKPAQYYRAGHQGVSTPLPSRNQTPCLLPKVETTECVLCHLSNGTDAPKRRQFSRKSPQNRRKRPKSLQEKDLWPVIIVRNSEQMSGTCEGAATFLRPLWPLVTRSDLYNSDCNALPFTALAMGSL